MPPAPDFHDIVADHYAALYRFAYSLSRNAHDASDLTQQTFLVWARKGAGLRDPGKVKSWLFTTLYREFLRQQRRSAPMQTSDEAFLEHVAPPAEPDQLSRLDAEDVLAALHRMEPAYREPLLLFYMEDLAYREIAEVLGIPIGTVMSRIARGKTRLKGVLSDEYGNNPVT
jgi:RNA polymerase sigma-70 factor (ECF subfamily)